VEEERTARIRLTPNIKDNNLSFTTGQWPDGLGSSINSTAEDEPLLFLLIAGLRGLKAAGGLTPF